MSEDDKNTILNCIEEEFDIKYKNYWDPSTKERRVKFKGPTSTIYKPVHSWRKVWSYPPLAGIS